ncbi:GNAT family N-acetyltransferase [Wenjunlia tyrosinilytica]|jgi:RimJ/RimL family protein N-acetyltransferase|uniref:N-acetyltransferase domain-containing protein n=1 Tax=Wenjunlia tyrosinilytica TaxID=1544741 RepID=A0A917ZSQ6_9ACTN|nr:GNAT family N-acetyltransferase [Wenjunlia tyrosinilytica]GGO90752.1 hypothetical protein GCM10012280_37000 [Wenjunlia tyrosinilytica]
MTTLDRGPDSRFPSLVRLSGEGLLLREWTEGDLEAMVGIYNDPQIDRWTPIRSPFDLETARTRLGNVQEARAADLRIHLAVTTDGGTPLGDILLRRETRDDRRAEIGYAITARHRGRGLATRSVRLLTAYAYGELAMEELYLRIDEDNEASNAVARATGFEPSGEEPEVEEHGAGRALIVTWTHRRGLV